MSVSFSFWHWTPAVWFSCLIDPSSISRLSVSMLLSLMWHLICCQISTWLCTQTTSILYSSSTRFQHYLQSTRCWFRLLTECWARALTSECSICLESIMRLLMPFSHLQNDLLAFSYPELVISGFQPPQPVLGAVELWASSLPLGPGRQPARAAWSMKCFIVECSISIGCALLYSGHVLISSQLLSDLLPTS